MRTQTSWIFCQILLIILLVTFGWSFWQDYRITEQLRLADRYISGSQTEFAEAIFRQVEQFQPWRRLDWVLLADQYLQLSKPAKAGDILEPFAESGRLDADGWSVLSRVYIQKGQDNKAEQALKKAIELSNYSSSHRGKIADLISFLRYRLRIEEALQYQKQMAQLSGNTQQSQITLLLLQTAEDPDEAWSEIGDLDNLPIWLTEWKFAVEKALVETDPVIKNLKIGRAFAAAGNWDLAEFMFTRVVQDSPQYADAWGLLAEARQQQGKDGQRQMERALSLSPDSPPVRLVAALYYRRVGNFQEAARLLEQNVNIEPNNLIWQNELARTYAEAGRLEEAVALYGDIYEREPYNVDILISLSRLCVQFEYRLDELGLPAAKKAVELLPDSVEANDILGQVYFAMGDVENAEISYSRAMALDADNASVWLHIGQLYLSGDVPEKAKDPLLKAAQLGGNAPEGILAGRLLKQYFNLVAGGMD